jgi:hypothetical protein
MVNSNEGLDCKPQSVADCERSTAFAESWSSQVSSRVLLNNDTISWYLEVTNIYDLRRQAGDNDDNNEE